MKPVLPPLQNLASGPAATPIAFIKSIALAYRHYGINPANALKAAQITPRELRHPKKRVTAAQMEIMSAYAMQELDDEALGWFSRRLPWGSYGMLCRASLTSPNLGVAIKRWCRHHRLLTDDIVLSLAVSGSTARVQLEVHRDLGEFKEFCLVSSLRYLLGFVCWAIDSRIPLTEASFPFAAPTHQEVYPLLFSGAIHFDVSHAGFSFDTRYLALPIQRDERALRQMLQRALPLTVLQYRRDRLLTERVQQFLRSHTADACTAESVSTALHVSIRTLHRQLEKDGRSLQQLKDHARRDHAMDLLTRTRQPIKQVAQAVGFRNEKSFARAFKGWTQKAPSVHRDEARDAVR